MSILKQKDSNRPRLASVRQPPSSAVPRKAQPAGKTGSVPLVPLVPGLAKDGVKLLDDLTETLRRYVVLPEAGAEAIALWVVFTYAIDAFHVAPILAIQSPTKRCGKTRLLSLLNALVHNPQLASSTTPAAMFRLVEKCQPTLLIHEADTTMTRSEELRCIVNAGHTRATAFVHRAVSNGTDFEPRPFSVWCAKVFAGIGELPDTVQDRSIVILMRRKLSHESVDRLREDRIVDEVSELREGLAAWVEQHREQLQDADPADPEGLESDRACDNWRPLLAIADAAGGDWPDRARHAAFTLSRNSVSEQDHGIQVLADLRDCFSQQSDTFIRTEEVLSYLHRLQERPWSEYAFGKPLNGHALAGLLKPFGVRPERARNGEPGGVAAPRGYSLPKLKDAFRRYLSETGTSGTSGTQGRQR